MAAAVDLKAKMWVYSIHQTQAKTFTGELIGYQLTDLSHLVRMKTVSVHFLLAALLFATEQTVSMLNDHLQVAISLVQMLSLVTRFGAP